MVFNTPLVPTRLADLAAVLERAVPYVVDRTGQPGFNPRMEVSQVATILRHLDGVLGLGEGRGEAA